VEKIREIRLSERKFYQKITDIYATALDYDPTATAWIVPKPGRSKKLRQKPRDTPNP
jgi:hypothetical protein